MSQAQTYTQESGDVAVVMQALSTVPETADMGVVLVRDDDVVICRRPLPHRSRWLVVEIDHSTAAAPPPPEPQHSNLRSEWVDLGLSCTGAVLSGTGAFGTVAAAPETGGLSLAGTAYLVSQTAVAFGQCSVSIYRVANIYRGNEAVNEALDRNPIYNAVMFAADTYALVDVVNVSRESVRFLRDVDEAEVSFSRLLGDLNRNERLKLTRALKLEGARRVASAKLNQIVLTRITQAVGGAMATAGSLHSTTGDLHYFVGKVRIWALQEAPEETEPPSSPDFGPRP